MYVCRVFDHVFGFHMDICLFVNNTKTSASTATRSSVATEDDRLQRFWPLTMITRSKTKSEKKRNVN